MVDYATEEEQIEALKRWWRENGRSIVIGVVLGLLALGGWRGWEWYTEQQSLQAASVYTQLVDRLEAGERESLKGLAERLRDEFPNTAYAPLGALAAARMAVGAGDFEAAAEWLRWATDNADADDLGSIARLRLARIESERERLDAALELLNQDHPEAFGGLYNEVRGDVLAQRGDRSAAVDAYKAALDAAVPPPNTGAVERKLNRLQQPAADAGEGEENS